MNEATNIPIVMYHSINDAVGDRPLGRLAFTTGQFRQHLQCFRKRGFNCITLDELYQRTLEGNLSEKLAVLTFDDGFLDNLTLARDIMKEYGVKGTIFVNPDQTSSESKDRSTCKNHWGRLTYPEMNELERDGTLTIQSHTLTHDFTFRSDRVVDFFSWEKRYKYFWLGALLFPGAKTRWVEDFDELQARVPVGYPIFEFERTLMAPKCEPVAEFVERCIREFSQRPDGLVAANACSVEKIRQESKAEYQGRVRHIVGESKNELESRLDKEIVAICFPGGGYDDFILECARDAGYRQYIFSSKDTGDRENRRRLSEVRDPTSMVGLRRFSFTAEQPAILKGDFFEYFNCNWHLDLFLGTPYAEPLMGVAKKAKSLLKLW